MDPNELDDEWKPTVIRIPKVTPGSHRVMINKTDIIVGKYKTTVTLKKQSLGGYDVPQGTVVVLNSNEIGWNLYDHVYLTDDVINKILRVLYFDSLRTKKK